MKPIATWMKVKTLVVNFIIPLFDDFLVGNKKTGNIHT